MQPILQKLEQDCHPPIEQPCRGCGVALRLLFADLGAMPLANSFLSAGDLDRGEQSLPLRAYLCENCFLVQLQDFVLPADVFRDYLYFSSYSPSWLEHARHFADGMIERLELDNNSFVVEIGSNDGYLLKSFVDRNIPCLGIEPAENVAGAARLKGVPTECVFFGSDVATRLAAAKGRADLIVTNNVVAHVPDLHDFLAGIRHLLAPHGTATIEAPHLLAMLNETQFDTIYHEHYSYLSLLAFEPAIRRHALEIFDIEELPTHGGSLRYHLRHRGDRPVGASVEAMRRKENEAGLDRVGTYLGFQQRVRQIKLDLLAFLVEAKRAGDTVAGYGAAAKGNTLLNYCGVDRDLIDFVADYSPHKQGRYLPGARIPVVPPELIFEVKPDYLLILPWNLKLEIMEEMNGIREWGGRFVWAIPKMNVV